MNDSVKNTDYVTSLRDGSSLVRRLVRSEGDTAKRRIRVWLSAIDDERLLEFGLTPVEIYTLRDPLRPAVTNLTKAYTEV
jgi:hypothetical protein